MIENNENDFTVNCELFEERRILLKTYHIFGLTIKMDKVLFIDKTNKLFARKLKDSTKYNYSGKLTLKQDILYFTSNEKTLSIPYEKIEWIDKFYNGVIMADNKKEQKPIVLLLDSKDCNKIHELLLLAIKKINLKNGD